MLMAQIGINGQLISANQDSNEKVVCPGCLRPVVRRAGSIRQPYFAHLRHQSCDSLAEGETSEHLTGKIQLAQWFSQQGATVSIEEPLLKLHQRPDLLINHRLAVEFQCSPISNQRLNERQIGYDGGHYQQLWLLGSPYQKKFQLHLTKIAKFIVFHPCYGACVLFWSVAHQCLEVRFNIGIIPLCPVVSQRKRFKRWHDWRQFWQMTTVSKHFNQGEVSAKTHRHQRQRLQWGLIHYDAQTLRWQAQCYQAKTLLQRLPDWVLGDLVEPPAFIQNELSWRIPLYLWWRAHPTASERQCQFAWTRIVSPQLSWLPNRQLAEKQQRQRLIKLRFQHFFSLNHQKQL